MAITSTLEHLQPPKTGVYVFSWRTMANLHSYFPMELIHNNARAGIIFAQGDAFYNGVTGLAIINIQQGDAVVVRTTPGYTPQGNINSNNDIKTSFPGWCISC